MIRARAGMLEEYWNVRAHLDCLIKK